MPPALMTQHKGSEQLWNAANRNSSSGFLCAVQEFCATDRWKLRKTCDGTSYCIPQQRVPHGRNGFRRRAPQASIRHLELDHVYLQLQAAIDGAASPWDLCT
jgi:hypothetical protein